MIDHLLYIPRNYNKILSFSYNFLYFFYFGAYILITLIFFNTSVFFSLKVSLFLVTVDYY